MPFFKAKILVNCKEILNDYQKHIDFLVKKWYSNMVEIYLYFRGVGKHGLKTPIKTKERRLAMSEKKAKKNKRAAAEQTVKVPADKSTILANVIIVFVILAVFGLGAYAVGSKYIKNNAASTDSANEAQTTTVADYIAEKGITFDEFKSEYGLEDSSDITEDSNVNSATGEMTLANYAKYADTTLEELKSQYGLGDDVPDTTLWQDAMSYMTTGVVGQNFFGADFETFKTQMGLPDSITADTPWSETQSVMSELYQQQQAAQDQSGDAQNAAEEPAATEAAGE